MEKAAKFEYYRDHVAKWRWRLKAPNGQIIADSGQGYVNESDCLTGMGLVQVYSSEAQIVQVAK